MKILVAVYDSKAEAYGTPKIMLTTGEAIRAFEDEAKDEKSVLKKFPTDFSLWQLGTYDERKGIVSPIQTKINLSNAWEINQHVKETTPPARA